MIDLPVWTHVAKSFLEFSECGDREQEKFDLWVRDHFGITIAEIDVWLAERLAAGKDCSTSLRRRAAVFEAFKANDKEAADASMECLWRARQDNWAHPRLLRDEGSQDGRSKGGVIAAKSKKATAEARKDCAVRRFKELIATGERDAREAMRMMTNEGWGMSTLYRHLKEELARIGRGRKPVKRVATKKTAR